MLRAMLDIAQLNNLPMPVTQIEMGEKPDLQVVLGEAEIAGSDRARRSLQQGPER